MSKFKISIDEDLFFFHTPKSIWSYLFFWKKWNYHIEIPINRLSEANLKKYGFIPELVIVKDEKVITIYLGHTTKNQREFLEEALNRIITDHIPYKEIKRLKKKYGV